MIARLITGLVGLAALVLVYFIITAVSGVQEAKDQAAEASGTCYRIAAENYDLVTVQRSIEDRFLTREECRKIYYLVDRRHGSTANFVRDKEEALKKMGL
jgi:hypothetical protein